MLNDWEKYENNNLCCDLRNTKGNEYSSLEVLERSQPIGKIKEKVKLNCFNITKFVHGTSDAVNHVWIDLQYGT